jgi:cytochrome oxidase Cu insertion factor (SCO1/SenC/PrrC family)
LTTVTPIAEAESGTRPVSPIPNAGDPAPAFRLTSHEGKTYSLEKFAGQPLILVFIRHLA